MNGKVDFTIAGTLGYVKDYPPAPNKAYGALNLLVKVPSQDITSSDGLVDGIKDHGLFLWVNYSEKDSTSGQFNHVKSRLVKGLSVLIQGTIKPKINKEGVKELSLAAHWRDLKISETPIRPRNEFIAWVELLKCTPPEVEAKYSYLNNLKKEWLERSYLFTLSGDVDGKVPATREPIYLKGRVFGLDTQGNKIIWLLAEEMI